MSSAPLLSKVLTGFRSPLAIIGPPKLPLDILEVIVDQADRHTQLKLSLVSRRIMYRSRNFLFDTLIFAGGGSVAEYERVITYDTANEDRQLDRLLDLIVTPTETISSSIRTIQIGNLFKTPFKYRARNDIHLLAMKLRNFTTLRLISIGWEDIPAYILNFFLVLCPNEVQLESVTFQRATSFVNLLQSPLIASTQKLSLFEVHVDPAVAKNVTSFTLQHHKQVFHFPIIDASSLVNFHQLWNDDFIRTAVTIKSFHLGFAEYFSESYGKEIVISFIKKVLLLIGPNLKSLFIDLEEYQFPWDLYAQVDLSQCTAVRELKLLMPTILNQEGHDAEKVWALVSGLPSAQIERIDLILKIRHLRDDGLLDRLQSIPWTEMVQRLRDVFPSLKQIQFILGDRSRTNVSLSSVLEAISRDICQFRRVDIDINFKPYFLDPFREPEPSFLWRSLLA